MKPLEFTRSVGEECAVAEIDMNSIKRSSSVSHGPWSRPLAKVPSRTFGRSRLRLSGKASMWDEMGLILLGICLVMANPGFGSVAIRYGVIFLGMVLVTWGSSRVFATERVSALLMGGLFIAVVIVEAMLFVNQENSRGLTKLLFRIMCYIFVLGGVSSALAMRRGRGVDLGVMAAVVPFIVLFSALRSLVAGYANALGGAGRIVTSEEFHPVGICYSYGLLAVVMFVIVMHETRLIVRICAVAAMVASVLVMLNTGSRGGVLSLLLSLALYIGCTLLRSNLRRRMRLIAVLGLVFGVALMASLVLGAGDQLAFLQHRFDRAFNYWNEDNSILARENTLRFYAERFSYWWFGGYYGYTGIPYPHNILVELWLRFGLIGFLGCVGLLWMGWKLVGIVWNASSNGPAMLLVLPAFFNFINAQTNLSLEFNRWLYLGVGFVIAIGPVRALSRKFQTCAGWTSKSISGVYRRSRRKAVGARGVGMSAIPR